MDLFGGVVGGKGGWDEMCAAGTPEKDFVGRAESCATSVWLARGCAATAATAADWVGRVMGCASGTRDMMV